MKNNIKICHITTGHSRSDTRVFIKECVSLAEFGFDVSLVVADGLGDAKIDNVNVYDVGSPKGRFDRFFKVSNKVYKRAKTLNSDIYHFHDPELMWFGNKLRKQAKVIYDIHEDVVQQIKIRYWIPSYLKPLVAFFFGAFENYICKRMSGLIVPQPYMKEKFSKKNSNTVLVENFVIFETHFDINTKSYENGNAFHPGVLSSERGLENMISTYGSLDAYNKLFLAGNIQNEIYDSVSKINGWKKTTYLGRITHSEVKKLYKTSSLGLILYNNVGQYHLSYAIKLFEYMANGIPVIMPNFGEWVAFNQENDCGINVDPHNSQEVANAINFLNNNIDEKKRLGRNGYIAVKEKYNWNLAKSRLIDLYVNLM